MKVNSLNKQKLGYLIHIWLDKAFKGNVVNRALTALHVSSLYITLTVPLTPSYLKVFHLLERGSPNRTTSGLTTP